MHAFQYPFRPEEDYSSSWKACLQLQPDVLVQRLPAYYKISVYLCILYGIVKVETYSHNKGE